MNSSASCKQHPDTSQGCNREGIEPVREFRNYAAGVATFGIILFVTLVIASFGMISLFTDTDVIAEADAGPLVGPSMVAAAVLTTFALWLAIAFRLPPKRIHASLPVALAIGLAAYFAFVVVGSILYVFSTGQILSFAIFMGAHMVSPFAVTVALIATIMTVLYLALLSGKAHGSTSPTWPWEP